MKRLLVLCFVALMALAFSTSALACNMNCDKRGTGQCFDDPTILAGCVQITPTSCVFEVCGGFTTQSPILAERFEVASVTVERPNMTPAVTRTPSVAVARATTPASAAIR
jgi:hypothetical protein